MKKKVIYDFGANVGDNITYYLPRSDVVVAVEANPALCRLMRERFKAEVQSSKLVVENCVVVDRAETSVIDFYIHKRNHRLSQLPRPAPGSLVLFEKVLLPVKTVAELIHCYGSPYYVKIDLEYCDARILRALFGLGVSPPFISAEAHSVEVFALLVALGGYNAFKLVDGYSVLGTYSSSVPPSGVNPEEQHRRSRCWRFVPRIPLRAMGGPVCDPGLRTTSNLRTRPCPSLILPPLSWRSCLAAALPVS